MLKRYITIGTLGLGLYGCSVDATQDLTSASAQECSAVEDCQADYDSDATECEASTGTCLCGDVSCADGSVVERAAPQLDYSGKTSWNNSTGVLTFTSSGTIPGKHKGWTVPKQVKKIVINKNVKVSGRFTVKHTMTIQGKDRKTSVIFGTNQTGYNKNNDGCGYCKSAVLAEGDITVTIKKLTSLNPFGFHFTGKKGGKLAINKVDAIDNRGGGGNNSDGVSAADGTVVKNSYFETGDDVFKVYSDLKVYDTTVKMIQNTVPIQFGWGDYGDGAKGEFYDLNIIGDDGRNNSDHAVISARTGKYNKTIIIDGLTVNNPNAALMNFRNDGGTAKITITKADIKVKKFRGKDWKMNVSPKVCGKTYQNGQGAPKTIKCT